MWSTAAKNKMLNAHTTMYVQAHDDYPGDDGSNEMGSPAVTRVALTASAGSGGLRSATNAPVLTIPVGTLTWIGLWDALTNGVYLGCMPVGGVRKRFFASATADTITSPAHGYGNGDKVVVFGGGTAPAPLVKGTIYFVVSTATDTFKVSETLGGSPVDLTSAGSGELFVSAIVPQTYGAPGTATVDASTLDLTT